MKLSMRATCAIFLACVSNLVLAQPIEVTPADNQGWFGRSTNTGTLGVGVDDRLGGMGSLGMVTDGSGGDIVKVARIPLITVDALTSISWDVYTDNASSYPRPQIEYYQLGGRAGTLTFVASNETVPLNSWTTITVDFNSDLFQSSESGASAPQSLAAWQAELSGVLINYFQLGYGSTTGATTVDANIDFVELNGTTWNFVDATPPVEPPPPAEFVTVDPTDQQGWFNRSSNTATSALSTDEPRGPGGTGSLKLTTDGSAGQIVNVARIPITTVDDITGVSWEFNSSGADGNQIPVGKIEYYSLSQSRSGTLVFNAPPGYTPGTWQAVDGFTGTWYSTEGGFGAGDPRTLAEWKVELEGLFVNYFSVGMGTTGGTFDPTTAYVDTVRFANSREDVTWDFEGTAALPPEPELTTTTITSSAPNPSEIGEAVTVSYEVAVVAPGVGTPTGTVTVTDGITRADLCSSTVAVGSCSIPAGFAAAGSYSLIASYVSDVVDDFADSTSDAYIHAVNSASYSVGGTVTGLTGTGLALQNNGADTLAIAADGAFTFATELADAATYAVTVSAQPTGQTCTVSSGSGTIAAADVTDVAVNCADDVVVPPPAPAHPIPVDSNWALVLLTMLMGLVVLVNRDRFL